MKYENVVNLVINSVKESSRDVMIFLTENKDEVTDYKSWVRIFEEVESESEILVTLFIMKKILVEDEDVFGMYQVSEDLVCKAPVLEEIIVLFGFFKLYRESYPEEWEKYLEKKD